MRYNQLYMLKPLFTLVVRSFIDGIAELHICNGKIKLEVDLKQLMSSI